MTIDKNEVSYEGILIMNTLGDRRLISLRLGHRHWLAPAGGRFRRSDGGLAGSQKAVPRLLLEHITPNPARVYLPITHSAQARPYGKRLSYTKAIYLTETITRYISDDGLIFNKKTGWSYNCDQDGKRVQIILDTIQSFIPEWKQNND
jgi:hypothetical protein